MEPVTPSLIAYLALILLVPFSIAAFVLWRAPVAVLVIMLGTTLFMPERVSFDAPAIPPLDKHSVAIVCVFIGLLVTSRDRFRKAKFGRGVDLFGVAAVIASCGTVLTNRDPVALGGALLPALQPGEIVTDVFSSLVFWVLPFYVGRLAFREERDAIDMLKGLAISGLLYSPLILIELKMSPQLHRWVYGFSQHSFLQTVREGGGYRPMCFMESGLALAVFMFSTVVASWTLVKLKIRMFNSPAWFGAAWLSALFPLIKSLASTIYAAICSPLVMFFTPRTQLRVALVIGGLVAAYPSWRASGTFPTEAIVDVAARAGQQRAQSLEFRLQNEEILLAHASDRPWFGWGTWGRNRIYDDEGNDISITDGTWVIEIGVHGKLGLAFRLALLLAPLLLALRQRASLKREHQMILGAMALITAFSAFDLLPNALFNMLPPFFAGSLAGLAHGLALEQRKPNNWYSMRRRLLLQLLRARLAPQHASLPRRSGF